MVVEKHLKPNEVVDDLIHGREIFFMLGRKTSHVASCIPKENDLWIAYYLGLLSWMHERYTHIRGSNLWLVKIASDSYYCSVCTNQVGTYNLLVIVPTKK